MNLPMVYLLERELHYQIPTYSHKMRGMYLALRERLHASAHHKQLRLSKYGLNPTLPSTSAFKRIYL